MGLIALAAGALAARWLVGRFSAVAVTGASMEPELSDGDRVPPEHLILLSDNNAEDTIDSRQLGYFSAGHLLGRVVKRLG